MLGFAEEVRLTVDVVVPVTTCGLPVSDPLLLLKLLSPLYVAVMVWLPTASVEAETVTTPPLSVPVPIVLPPSRNVTVPVAVPDPGPTGATVAVKVTDFRTHSGLPRMSPWSSCWPY